MSRSSKNKPSFKSDIKHDGYTLLPKLEQYEYGEGACLIFFETGGEDYITLSTNLSSDKQSSDSIFIKQDDSHLEIAELMVKLGYLVEKNAYETSGYNKYRLYGFTAKLNNLIKDCSSILG